MTPPFIWVTHQPGAGAPNPVTGRPEPSYLRAAPPRDAAAVFRFVPTRTAARPVRLAGALTLVLRAPFGFAGTTASTTSPFFFARLRARFHSLCTEAACLRARFASRLASFSRLRARRSSSFASRTRCPATSACSLARSIGSPGPSPSDEGPSAAGGISLPVFFMSGPAKGADGKSHTRRTGLPPRTAKPLQGG